MPGATGSHWGSEVSINAHGLRDREYELEKPPGVLRVVVIGDSIPFGFHLAVDESYPDRLESRLAFDGRPAEVLNLGVGGYDTLNAVASFERTGVRFDPDVVVLSFCINDVGTQSVNLAFLSVLEEYASWVRRSRLLQLVSVRGDLAARRIRERASRHETDEEFRAANPGRIVSVGSDPRTLELMRELRRYRGDRRNRSSHPFLAWYRSEGRVGKLRYGFERLSRFAAPRGIPVVLLLVPLLDEEGHEPGYRIVYDLVRHEAERVGFVVVDAGPAVRDRGAARLMLSVDGRPDPIHPNAAGHRLLASELAPVITQLLDGRVSGFGGAGR